jgi:hypothetical protein
MHRFKAFPELKSVKIIVEERRIDLELNPGNWRTHEYKGLSSLPDRLMPAFASPGTQAEVDLIDLIHQVCASGNAEARFELPYQDGAGQTKRTVLRTIVIHLYHNKVGCAATAPRAAQPGVCMPLGKQGVWSVYELHQVERQLASSFTSLSPAAVSLVVRLAKLDVPPSAGASRLLKHAKALAQRGSGQRVN